MAFIGVELAVFAPIVEETDGSPIVYGSGTVLGRIIKNEVTFNRNSDKLYADDVEAESDNSITGGTVKIGLDDIAEDAQVSALGLVRSGEEGAYVYSEVSDAAPSGGYGYLRVRKKAGVISYIAYWIHKVQLSLNSETSDTKGERITWNTPTLESPILGVRIKSDGKTYFRDRQVFTTLAAATAFLRERANIQST